METTRIENMEFLLQKLDSLRCEITRRKYLPYFNYNSGEIIHKKQLTFHQDTSRSRWVLGGNRTGKTECGAMEAVWWALGTHPYWEITGATEGWVVSLTTQVQRDVAQAKILKYLDFNVVVDIVMKAGKRDAPEHGVIDFLVVKNKFGTTSKIGFKSVDQGRERFQGTSLDWIWFDEEPSEEIYEESLLRTLDRGGVVWGTMTPLKGRTWLYEKVYLNSGTGHSIHQISWEDNPFLKQNEIKKMEQSLSRESLESRKYGRIAEGSGIVFSELDDENIIDPFEVPVTWQRVVSIDPGYVAPTGVVVIAFDEVENIYVVDDYLQSEKTIAELSIDIKQLCEKNGILRDEREGGYHVLIDCACLQRSLGSPTSVFSQLRTHEIIPRVVTHKNVLEGVLHIKALLRNAENVRRLFIFKNCKNLLREMRSYSWGDDETPKKRNDHCIDALRYAMTNRRPTAKKRDPTDISKKKDALVKINRRK
ncbi:MAG: terminase family protein [Firmicutes bacterium]|nr:terminase family protein [Bacillota bacterium]